MKDKSALFAHSSTPLNKMFLTSSNLKVYISTAPCDMRKSFDGLQGIVQSKLNASAQSGALFVFLNKKRTLMKALYWDGSGFWVFSETSGTRNV